MGMSLGLFQILTGGQQFLNRHLGWGYRHDRRHDPRGRLITDRLPGLILHRCQMIGPGLVMMTGGGGGLHSFAEIMSKSGQMLPHVGQSTMARVLLGGGIKR